MSTTPFDEPEELDEPAKITDKVTLVKYKARRGVRAWKNGKHTLTKITDWLGEYDGFYARVEPTEQYESYQNVTVVVTHVGFEGSMRRSVLLDFIEDFSDCGNVELESRSKNMDYTHIVVELG
jgi:hypothetical protein